MVLLVIIIIVSSGFCFCVCALVFAIRRCTKIVQVASEKTEEAKVAITADAAAANENANE